NLTLKSLQSICDHLECTIADLFPGKGRSPTNRSDKTEG
ncbi:MAG: helix-turn-helix domain-containing protein, partial [Candidatus Omnitrophica bacterium]|nr:helix-turn-helix domain-containing protein [Candidatus Omnitrophota bacterium]